MLPERKMAGELICVPTESAWKKQGNAKAWSDPLARRSRRRYMNPWKRRWNVLSQNKALSLIGLAVKAGKVASGEFCTEKEVKSGRAALVIVAGDASGNTKKKFQNMCSFYRVPIYFYKDKDTLGHAMGKEFRASLAVTDEGFAKGIRKHLDTEENTIA